jgi:hypothetical protein
MLKGSLRPTSLGVLVSLSAGFLSCSMGNSNAHPVQESPSVSVTGVLMWKSDLSGVGLYSSETTLTPATVNVNQFGRLGSFKADGIVMGQPLYVANLKLAKGAQHNVIILATEHDSVYAIDADNPSGGSLWERHYTDPANGLTTMPDSFGGRTTLGGEVGITGTPFIDSATGALYFVTTMARNGVPDQWLRAIDITSGNDFGPGAVQIQASVSGDGRGSVDDQIEFDPSIVRINGQGWPRPAAQSSSDGDRSRTGVCTTAG